jgi:putative nucleotidyltransferase with HDIG domain
LAIKDGESHSKRVTAFTIAIARALGLPRDQIATIARGAFLHDIGKIATPDELLCRRGALTPEELAVLRGHCLHGFQLLKKVPFLSEAAEIVYSHHERYDGTGYPRGLRGKEIPLGARIVAVADALDTITSDTPYRAARALESAREDIRRCSGSQFDPEIVEVFLAMHAEIWNYIRAEI